MKSKILIILFCILLIQVVFSETEISVTEEDKVNLEVTAEDPDNDPLFFTFSSPLDEDGVWDTKIGDEGSYNIQVSVCDREYCDSEIIRLNVLHKELGPDITYYSPKEFSLDIKEGDSVFFNAGVEDMDSSKLFLSWEVDGEKVSTALFLNYSADKSSAGRHTVKFTASDLKFYNQLEWKINVENVNSAPILKDIKDIEISEGETATISPEATDLDGDKIFYSISEPVGDDGVWETTYGDKGEYYINITASDSYLSDTQAVKLTVKKTDRVPVIAEYAPEESKIYAKEGEGITFSVKAGDPDGDELSYTWTIDDEEIGDKRLLGYNISFDSAGTHTVKCSISDGTVKITKEWILVVEDVNQPPVLEVEEMYIFDEGDVVRIVPDAFDPDGDEVKFFFSEPLDSYGEWKTDYTSSGVYAVNISASDRELSDSKFIKLIINNIDQQPVLKNISPVYVDEGTDLSIKLDAYDPDGDDIIFSTENLPEGAYIEDSTLRWYINYDAVERQTGWLGRLVNKLDFYDFLFDYSKEFNIKVAAAAKESSSVQDLKIVVFNKNRPPVLDAPKKIKAEENELVKINYTYYDEDNDSLVVMLSKPFNIYGGWQTDFEDSGEYNISISVDDDSAKVTKNVSVYVENKNREPLLMIDDHVVVEAGKDITLKPKVIDLDKEDNITIVYSGWMDSFYYQTDKNDTGIHNVTVTAFDGTDYVSKDITIEVKEPSMLKWYMLFGFIGLLLLLLLILLLLWYNNEDNKEKRKKKKEAKLAKKEKEKAKKLAKKERKMREKERKKARLLAAKERKKKEKEKKKAAKLAEKEKKKEEKERRKAEIASAKAAKIAEKKIRPEAEEETESNKDSKGKFRWLWIILLLLLLLAVLIIGLYFLFSDTGDIRFDSIRDRSIDEGKTLEIKLKTKNADGIDIYGMPSGSKVENSMIIWTPDYDQAGVYSISAKAFNNQSDITRNFTITVRNVNMPPKIISSSPASPVSVYTNKKIPFAVSVRDDDNDSLSYTWSFGHDEIYIGTEKMTRVFTLPGKKTVKLKVCDDKDCSINEWKVTAVEGLPETETGSKTYVVTEVADEIAYPKDDVIGDNRATYVIIGGEKEEVPIDEDRNNILNRYVIYEKDDDSVVFIEEPKEEETMKSYNIE